MIICIYVNVEQHKKQRWSWPASRRKGQELIPNKSICDWWWKMWHWGQVLLPKISGFPCHYHSTNATYWFTHLSPTLYNLSIWPCLSLTHIPTIE